MPKFATPNLLRPSHVASRLGLSVSRIRQLAEDGRLECVVTPYGRLFAQDDVEALASKRDRHAEQG